MQTAHHHQRLSAGFVVGDGRYPGGVALKSRARINRYSAHIICMGKEAGLQRLEFRAEILNFAQPARQLAESSTPSLLRIIKMG
jgi:hypothetical protein